MRAALLLGPLVLPAQQPESLPDRIRNCHLAADQRAELAQSFAAKNYSRVADILDREAAAAGTPAGAAELRALAGAVEFVHGDMQQAAAAFRQAASAAPLSDADRFTWAMALVNLGDTNDARQQLTGLHELRPNRPLYLYWLARLDYNQRIYEEAVAKFKQVIAMDPAWPRAYDGLGLALDMWGRPDEARNAFLKAVDLNRKLARPSPWPPHDLGALLLRLQQLTEAENALREALRYDPTLAMAHYHLGRTLEAEGQDTEAMDEYRAAISHEPVVMEAYYSLGLLCRRHGLAQEAKTAFAEYKKHRAESPQ